MSISNESISSESVSNESVSHEQVNEGGCDYTVSIKLNIPIQVEPQVFTKAASFCTNQKFQIRIQPEIQMNPEVKASVTNCVTQTSSDESSNGYFPELIVEGILEQA